jgi:ribose 1,5-bisphosphokinase PhnN
MPVRWEAHGVKIGECADAETWVLEGSVEVDVTEARIPENMRACGAELVVLLLELVPSH